jgi:hypothetical protein
MFSAAMPLLMSADQKRELELLVRNGNCPQRVALLDKVRHCKELSRTTD